MFQKKKRGQASIEYITVVAIALLIIIPATFLFFRYTSDSQDSLLNSQVEKIGTELIDTGRLMFSFGENSWRTMELTFPADIHDVIIYDDGGISEFVLKYTNGDKLTESVFFTNIDLGNSTSFNCTSGCHLYVHSGLNKIRVESHTGGQIVYRVTG